VAAGKSPVSSNRVAANRNLLSSRAKAVIREVSKAAWTVEFDLSSINGWPRPRGGAIYVWD
jgi:hypothetical protein